MGLPVQAGSQPVPVIRMDRRGRPILRVMLRVGSTLVAVRCPECSRTLMEVAFPEGTPRGLIVRKVCGCCRTIDIVPALPVVE